MDGRTGSQAADDRTRRWLARLALVSAVAAIAVLLGFAGLASIWLIAVGIGGLAVTFAGLWWFLSRRGLLRWLALALAIAAPIAVGVIYALDRLIWVVALCAALWAVALAAGRTALSREAATSAEYDTPPPKRAYLIMNPRSGGGKVVEYGLVERARGLGAEVFVLDASRPADVGELARAAVKRGADLLGVAGGDGTQALVAAVAAEYDLPFMVISAGTRNHFALDLGLDRADPSRCLDAFTDGVELRVDLGMIGDRPFVNNASFGAYAEVVQSPAYRDDKTGTSLAVLPHVLTGQEGPNLVARSQLWTIERPQALLVSNNPYELNDLGGIGRRPRLDGGRLGVLAVTVNSAVQAAGLVRGPRSRGLTTATTDALVVESDAPSIPVGIDGEAVRMPTPVRCEIRPKALRVRVPRHRPGVARPKPVVNWRRLWHLAVARRGSTVDEEESTVDNGGRGGSAAS